MLCAFQGELWGNLHLLPLHLTVMFQLKANGRHCAKQSLLKAPFNASEVSRWRVQFLEVSEVSVCGMGRGGGKQVDIYTSKGAAVLFVLCLISAFIFLIVTN